MKHFTWWRMEQVQNPLSRELCGAFCSILHHEKCSMSHSPYGGELSYLDPDLRKNTVATAVLKTGELTVTDIESYNYSILSSSF